MNKIKEAYDALMEAIREETGANPNMAISFHSHYADNSFLMDNENRAAEVARKMYEALGLLGVEYNVADKPREDGSITRWYEAESTDHRTDIAVFM